MRHKNQTIVGVSLLCCAIWCTIGCNKPGSRKNFAAPADTPVTVSGGSIISRADPSPWNAIPSTTGWRVPASTNPTINYKQYALFSREYSNFVYYPLTRPWQIHFTARLSGGGYQDSSQVPESQRRGLKLCSDINGTGDNCLPVDGAPNMSDNFLYLFPLNNSASDSIVQAFVDDDEPNGNPPYHRVQFHAGDSCPHCEHISDVILRTNSGSCRIKCRNSQCLLFPYKDNTPSIGTTGPTAIVCE